MVRDLVGEPAVLQLSDATYWGKQIEHERYLLTATALPG